MKKIKTVFLLLFALLLLVPLAAFRRGTEIVSEIDNRKLQENPFSAKELAMGGDLTKKLEKYVQDRIGFRDEMILGYTLLNDRLFGEMVHRTYCYGKEGYVYFRPSVPKADEDYYAVFAGMVVQIRDYCQDRGVPFLFVMEPAKEVVLPEYLPDGVNYDIRGRELLFSILEEQGVPFLDGAGILRERTETGEVVFNRVYDAGHWNELGGFYVTQAILKELRKDFPGVHVNTLDEFQVSESLKTSLQVSQFPIHEMVPVLNAEGDESELDVDGYVDEVYRDKMFQSFGRYVNDARLREGSPRMLMFQGSHMNSYGYKCMKNALGEYTYVHNYENIIDFDYYFNIFQPECVVFEVAESSLRASSYFDYERMKAMSLNPVLEEVRKTTAEPEALPLEGVSVQQGEALTKLTWTGVPTWLPEENEATYVWAVLGGESFDMRRSADGGWEVTVKNEVWDRGEALELFVLDGGRAVQLS